MVMYVLVLDVSGALEAWGRVKDMDLALTVRVHPHNTILPAVVPGTTERIDQTVWAFVRICQPLWVANILGFATAWVAHTHDVGTVKIGDHVVKVPISCIFD
jgi:hypothetical protein